MIKVTYKNCNGSIELCIKGHALFGEYGKDVICGAVSSIVIGGLNAIKEIDSFDITIEEGFVNVKSKSKVSNNDLIVIETILVQLATIEKKYPKNLKIIREELL